MAWDSDGNLRWKCVLILWSLAATVHQAGGCGDDGNKRNKDESDKCWYKLWYFWFIIVLAFLVIIVLIFFYCKQQAKRSSGHRGRRRTPVLTMPMAPPQYEAPGHQPPPYHIAMSTTVPDPVSTQQGQGHGTAPGRPQQSQTAAQLPGYILEPGGDQAYDNLSLVSTISIGAFSNPPPYSPPHTSHSRARQDYRPTEDVPL